MAFSCGHGSSDDCLKAINTPMAVRVRTFDFHGRTVVLSAVSSDGTILLHVERQRASLAEASRQTADPVNGYGGSAIMGAMLGLIIAVIRHLLFVRKARKERPVLDRYPS